MLFLSVPRLDSIPRHPQCAIELRLDLFPGVDLDSVQRVLHNAACPIMLTLRKTSQRTEEERERLIGLLLALEPHFFDLESDMRPQFLHETIKRYPKTKFILSHHVFEETSVDLEGTYRSMKEYPVFGFKIAVMVQSTNEALQHLLFVKTHPKTSVVCMGESGTFARVLGPVVENCVDYACGDEKEQTGPGQLTVAELGDIYRYPSLNEKTEIYGLIGDPVEKSPGHLYHNAVFRKRQRDAVYVKMRVTPEELSAFIPLAKSLGIRGLSVTMPLKEKILPFIDAVDPMAKQIGAVNTLRFENGRIIGINTDGVGALDAVEKKIAVRGKRVVLLGAGGAARAIAFEAKARGAEVVILNRTVRRAQELAAEMRCAGGGLDAVPDDYDVLINSSPDPMPIDPCRIKPKTVVMDVVSSPRETVFLKEASFKGCQIVYGEEMFANQAARQTAFWIGP